MWRDIKGYEGLYEINENAVVRRVDGTGIDGRKVSTQGDNDQDMALPERVAAKTDV